MSEFDRSIQRSGERVIWPAASTDCKADFEHDEQRQSYEDFCISTFWIPLCRSARLAALQLRVIDSLAQEKYNSHSHNKILGVSFKHGLAASFSLCDLQMEGVDLESAIKSFANLTEIDDHDFTSLLDKQRLDSQVEITQLLENDFLFLAIPKDHYDLFGYGFAVAENIVDACKTIDDEENQPLPSWSSN